MYETRFPDTAEGELAAAKWYHGAAECGYGVNIYRATDGAWIVAVNEANHA